MEQKHPVMTTTTRPAASSLPSTFLDTARARTRPVPAQWTRSPMPAWRPPTRFLAVMATATVKATATAPATSPWDPSSEIFAACRSRRGTRTGSRRESSPTRGFPRGPPGCKFRTETTETLPPFPIPLSCRTTGPTWWDSTPSAAVGSTTSSTCGWSSRRSSTCPTAAGATQRASTSRGDPTTISCRPPRSLPSNPTPPGFCASRERPARRSLTPLVCRDRTGFPRRARFFPGRVGTRSRWRP
mmetsp:Transcript_5351/g.13210  ORF Transcript_5351/g.13210 Transcript_5351/m.13210 type:complete len:243 (+) Transcript_5351:542-1270(+)